MSSILTNTSAMVALQTLKSVNSNLEASQNEIATGKSISSAKDNSAIWAISKVMEADVNGFKAISGSLSLGESTLSVATTASETVTDLLTDIKGKIVAAQEENVDREKIQTDISALRDQISAVVGAAQFNGLNLVQGTEDMNILSSLDRSGDGSVAASNITVNRQDLTTAAGALGGGASLNANATASAGTISATGNTDDLVLGTHADYSDDTLDITIGGTVLSFGAGDLTGDQDAAATTIRGQINALGLEGITASGTGATITLTSTRAFEDVEVTTANASTALTTATATVAERAENITFSAAAAVSEGDGYRASVGGTAFTYVAGAGETFEDVAKGLKTAIDGGTTGVTTNVSFDATNSQWVLKIDNSGADLSLAAIGNEDGTASGGLFGLDSIDVSTNAGADAALDNIETLIQSSINAAANFGSAAGRIESQSDFIGKLTDSLKAGIGTLVDADMEAASARLTALQTQQQLATQSLSIANQAPQSILSLFR